MKKNSFGTKTAIALAIAAFAAGAAVAADPADELLKLGNDMTFTSDVTISKETTGDVDSLFGGVKEAGVVNWQFNAGTVNLNDFYIAQRLPAGGTPTGIFVVNGGTLNINATDPAKSYKSGTGYYAGAEVNHIVINGGTINLKGTKTEKGEVIASLGAYDDFTMNGGTLNIGTNAKVWLSTDGAGYTEEEPANAADVAMQLKGGTVNLSGGMLAAGDNDTANKLALEGTNINVEAEGSVIQAATIEQTAGTIHVAKGDLTVRMADTSTHVVKATYTMENGAVVVDAGASVTFDTAVTGENGQWATTDGQIRMTKDAVITDGTIDLKATAANLEANGGKGHWDGVGLVVGDQDAAANLTLGANNSKLVANVQDGAHIDAFGDLTINGGTFNVGGALYGSVNNDDGHTQAWRQGSQIYAGNNMSVKNATINLGQNAIIGADGGNFSIGDDATLNIGGARNAVSVIGAWADANSFAHGSTVNVDGVGVVDFDTDKTELQIDGDLNIGANGTLVVTSAIEQFYDKPATTGGKTTGAVTVDDAYTGLVVLDGTVTVGGDVVADSVMVGSKTGVAHIGATGAIVVNEHGYVETNTLTLGNAGSMTIEEGGELYVAGDIVYGVDSAKSEQNGFTNKGSVYANLSELGEIKIADDESQTLSFTKNGNGILFTDDDTGTFFDLGETSAFRLSQYNSLQTAWGEKGDLVLLNATVTNDKGGMLTFGEADNIGLISPNTTVSANLAEGATEKTVTLAPNSALVVADVQTDAETVKVDSSKNSLTIAGTGGTLFGDSVKTIEVSGSTANALRFGYEADEDYLGGRVAANVKLGTTGLVQVAAGEFEFANGVTFTGTSGGFEVLEDGEANIAGGIVAETGASQAVRVSGKLSTDAIAIGAGGKVYLNGGVFSVAQKYVAPVATQAEEAQPFDGAIVVDNAISYADAKGAHTTGNVYGIGTANADAALSIAEGVYGDDLDQENVIVLQSQVKWTAAGNGEIGFGANGTTGLIVDVASVAATQGFKAEDGVIQGSLTGVNGKIVLQNITNKAITTIENGIDANGQPVTRKVLKLATSSDMTGSVVDYGSIFYGDAESIRQLDREFEEGGRKLKFLANYGEVATDGTVSFEANENVMHAVRDVLDINVWNDVESAIVNVDTSNELANRITYGIDDLIVASYNQGVDLGLEGEELNRFVRHQIEAAGESLNIGTNMAVAGGAFSTAVDINNEVWKALDRRMSAANLNAPRNAYGVTPWVDVIGTTNEAKDIFGGAGYEADIYGAVLGADWTAPCGAIVGLAFSVGQADANSVDLDTKVDNDVDFWGVSLYGSHRVGNFNGKVDFGYVSTSNDLSAHTAFGKLDESLDADIFTIGLGGEYIVNAGSFDVVPHAGIRWSSIDMDSSKYGADYDKMNLFQMPIGVTFSGTIEMTGWKVAPMVDLSVVPAFGDKDAVASFEGGINDTTRVVDTNPIQMTLGVNAQVDAWTFGVNYGLTAGGEERLNNSFNLNARYTF